jgi:translation initiation factor IF-1
MPGDSAFKVEGVIVEILPNGTYRLDLANGHRLLGFVAGRAKLTVGPLSLGERVMVQLSPFDLSQGRILVNAGGA